MGCPLEKDFHTLLAQRHKQSEFLLTDAQDFPKAVSEQKHPQE